MKLITPAEARSLDGLAVEKYGMNSLQLMENAARGLCAAALDMPEGGAVCVVCGKGNNGGDGYAAARLLRISGVPLTIIRTGEAKTPDAIHNANICEALDIPILEHDSPGVSEALRSCGLIIDALLGTGLSQPPSAEIGALIEKMNASGTPILSADLPSGLDGLSGRAYSPCVKAHTTVTFGAVKLGLALYPGHLYAGRIITAHIGFPFESADKGHYLIDAQMAAGHLPERGQNSHKGSHGHVAVLAGSRGMAGACAFACAAALRTGAGLVSAALPMELYPALAALVPEVVGSCLEDSAGGCYETKHIPQIKEFLKGKSALILGPGISNNAETQPFLAELLAHKSSLPQVWDADALNIIAQKPELWDFVPRDCVITPHPGEMARLCGADTAEVQDNRVELARQLAADKKVVVVLKGNRTVIATPGGTVCINPTGHPAMATAGMGDVLSGILGTFLAQGLSPEWAAVCAVYLHGLAGETAIAELGSDRGLLATDVIRKIPAAIGQTLCHSKRSEENFAFPV